MVELAIITIGESPRRDFDLLLKKYLSHVKISEYGVLDEYDPSVDYIKGESNRLVSKLSDGSQVVMGHDFAAKQIQLIVDKINFENSANIILLACTGKFTNIISNIPILLPDKLCGFYFKTFLSDEKLTVCVPNNNQINYIIDKWKRYDIEVDTVVVSPYLNSEIELYNTFISIKKFNNRFVVADCIGYDSLFKSALEKNTKSQVFLPQEIVFSSIGAFV